MSRCRLRRSLVATAVVTAALLPPAIPAAAAAQSPGTGPGGPILVIAGASNPFSRYYAEILRNEGLNAFAVADLADVTPATLAAHEVAILGETALSAGQVTMLADWVEAGGDLIAMRPDKQLASLLGLVDAGGTLSNAYLRVDVSRPPGAGIVGQAKQFHGTADRYALDGATSVAGLYADATTATPAPAVTVRTVGSSGGSAAAFTYDLARSVVYTRQGNPAWAGQERDGSDPIRSDDLFYGPAAFDPQPNWVDFANVAIPQADEQQRLLANLIGVLMADTSPLPRFWYFPRGVKAAVIMTGDDHAGGGTAGRFNQFLSSSPAGCAVERWECIRGTSYVYPNSPLTNAQAASYTAQGFEVALHVNTGCNDFTRASLENTFASQLSAWRAKYASVPSPRTERTHCIAWSDWASTPKVELMHGMRLDANYYYWPPGWILNRPGVFTGSGMPMRFADLDGTLLDVYQSTTQMTDESGQSYPFTVNALLDAALGPAGYYGAFNANMHTDSSSSSGATAIVASAKARGVPVVSAQQMLTWLDGRNGSAFEAIAYAADVLHFRVSAAPGASGLQAMVPATFGGKALTSVTRDGAPVSFTRASVKGVEYALLEATTATYAASYAPDTAPPAISGLAASAAADGTATVSWTTDEPADSRVDFGLAPDALDRTVTDAAHVTAHSVRLTGLTPGATYHYRVRSADASGNAAEATGSFSVPASVTAFPATTTIQTGTLRGGNAASLTADDNVFFQVNSTTSGTRTTSWYGSFTGAPASLSNLKVTYVGKNSRSCSQVVSIWRWSDGTWRSLSSRTVGTGEVTLADLVPSGPAAGYVSASGQIRVRVRCTASASFFASGEVLKLTYAR